MIWFMICGTGEDWNVTTTGGLFCYIIGDIIDIVVCAFFSGNEMNEGTFLHGFSATSIRWGLY